VVGLEDRQFLSRDIDPAHAAGARLHLACEIAGIDMQTLCNAEVPTTDSSRAMAGSWPCPRRQTVVIYIAPTSLAIICKQLIAHGLSPDWPAAVVGNGPRRPGVAVPDDRRRSRAAGRSARMVQRRGRCRGCDSWHETAANVGDLTSALELPIDRCFVGATRSA
jgi:hypothetical protein